MNDLNCLSYWFPKIRDAGLPVPVTCTVDMPKVAERDLYRTFDGLPLTNKSRPFFKRLRSAVRSIGLPCFLRSGHTSAKHDWKRSCYVQDASRLESHVAAIMAYGEMCSLMGLPWGIWAVREYLPISPIAICPRYGDMPVCREFRMFVRDGDVICMHPYWPDEALVRGGADVSCSRAFGMTDEEERDLRILASRAGFAVGGNWSVDILYTTRGWFVTDMAEADKSFHWEGCKAAAPPLTASGKG